MSFVITTIIFYSVGFLAGKYEKTVINYLKRK